MPKRSIPSDKGVPPGAGRASPVRSLSTASAGLVLVVLIAYAPALSSDFVLLDDYQYVVDNALVRRPSCANVARFFAEVRKPSTVDGYYQPLTMTSLMVDTWLARALSPASRAETIDPFAYHLTNVLLHAAASVLVMLMVRSAVGGVAVPFLAALVFAVHPVQVESVAWISQRKTVLSSLLAIGCVVCYLKSARTRFRGIKDHQVQGLKHSSEPGRLGPVGNAGGRRFWLGLSVLLYVAGGLAKPTVMLLPLVLPLLDIWPLRRRPRATLVEKLPFFLLMPVMAWVAWVSQASSSAQLSALDLSARGTLARAIGLMCTNLMLYLGNVFWPMFLSPYRELPTDLSLTNAPILWSVIGSIGLGATCLGAIRWSKPLFVGGAAFVILLSPTLGAVRFAESCVADRFCYLPIAFLLLPLAALLLRIERFRPRRVGVVRVCAGLFAVPLLILMWAQQGVWRDSHALWAHVVRTAPTLAKGHAQFAVTELESGAFESALSHARRATEIDRENAGYLLVLGRALVRSDRAGEAVAVIRRAIDGGLGPIEPLARVSLAEALVATGDVAGARAACDQAIAMGRGQVSTYVKLGEAALRFAKSYNVAADYYRLALSHDPDNATIRWNLGTALEYCGRDAEALDQYERVIATWTRRGLQPPDHMRWAADKVRTRVNHETTRAAEE